MGRKMGEKVLGFNKKDADITCIKCHCFYDGNKICPSCGTINSEDTFSIWRERLVPVRLKSESVSIKDHEVIINKEKDKYTKVIEEIANNQIKEKMKELKKPVVSLQALEKKIKETKFKNEILDWQKSYNEALRTIFNWAKKQASENK